MAEVDDVPFSLMSLEDELTCSICLSTFDCPVTTPCGHNFCQDCLLATWKDSYSCPQCRTHFPTKPDLKKNTVLSTVVETFTLRSNKIESSLSREEEKAEKKDVIRCDACMEAVASQTCLTCMASYCEEHLRPHRENPNFSVHQLTEPVGDLFERICPDHHKVMELFCAQHGRLICSLCLQQVHKGCSFMSPEEQRNLKESEFRDKVALLVGKIDKTEMAMLHMNDTQNKLKEEASKRKAAVAAVYQQMRDMLAQDERDAQITVDRELEIGQTKLRELVQRLTDNTETMAKARENINGVLSQSQTLAFLQASFDLPKVAKFEPHVPRINLDTNKVAATQAFARALKEQLTDICKQPVEARLPIVKPVQQVPPQQKRQPRPYCPSGPPIPSYFQPIPVPFFPCMGSQGGWNPSRFAQGPPSGYHMAPPFMARQRMALAKKSDTSHKTPQGRKTDASHPTPLAKKSDTSHQSPHNQDKEQPSAPSDNKPGTQGSAKIDKPKSHPPSAKSTTHHPQQKKKNK